MPSTFTFEKGVTVKINKVSPLVGTEIRRAALKQLPKPPKVPVLDSDGKQVIGFDGSPVYELNPADEEYKSKLNEFEEALQEKGGRALIKLGVDVAPDKAEVERVRAFMKNEFEIDLDPDDKYVYVTQCLLSSQDELTKLVAAIQGISVPDEEGVQAAQDTFRG